MTEIMITLKLNVKNCTHDTEEDLQAKVREYIAMIVGNATKIDDGMSLIASTLTEEVDHKDIKPKDQLLRTVNTHSVVLKR